MLAAFVRLATARSIVASLVDLERTHHHHTGGRRPACNNNNNLTYRYDKISRVQVIRINNSYGVHLRLVEAIVRERRLRWLGHIERLGPDHLLYIVLHSQATNGSRARGKQPHAYRHAAVEDLKKAKIDTKTWQTVESCDSTGRASHHC